MNSRLPTLPQLVRITCDTVAEVLDAYREHNAELPNAIRPLVLEDVKNLHKTLEQYEKQILDAGNLILGAAVYPQRDTQLLLDDCGTLGKQLLMRIRGNRLRDSIDTRREIAHLTQSVVKLVAGQDDEDNDFNPVPPVPDAPIDRRADDWNGRSRSISPEMAIASSSRSMSAYDSGANGSNVDPEELRNILDSLLQDNDDLKRENQDIRERLEMVEANDQSKLHHIKRLHSAVKGLGMRHAMRHRLNNWDELTDELPVLLDHIESTNELLKDLEPNPGPAQAGSARSRADSVTQSAPASALDHHSVREVALRPPSPTDSNVSTARVADSRMRRAHRNDRRRNIAPERRSFWNP